MPKRYAVAMDVQVITHAIKTDDENDGKRHCAVLRAGKPPRVIHMEEADSADIQKLVKRQLDAHDDWRLATENPIRRETLKEHELNDAAQDSFQAVLALLKPMFVGLANLSGQRAARTTREIVKMVLDRVSPTLLAEAQTKAGLSDSEVRAQLLHLAMQMNNRKPNVTASASPSPVNVYECPSAQAADTR